jgi:hypothetical protein
VTAAAATAATERSHTVASSEQKTEMIAIGDEDTIYAYERETNGQVANFREATDEERAEFAAQADNKAD